MPNESTAGLSFDNGAQFCAGFLTTAVAIAVIYTAFQAPVLRVPPTQLEVVKRLSFGVSMNGYPRPSTNSTSIAKSHVAPSALVDRPTATATANRPSHQQAAAHEIAGRFAELTPVVSPGSAIATRIAFAPNDDAVNELRPAPTASSPGLPRNDDQREQTSPHNVGATPTILPAQPTQPTPTVEAAHAAAPQPSVRLSLTRSRNSTTRFAFPLDLNPAWAEKPNAGLLIGGLPPGVTLTSGRPTALGLWKLLSVDAHAAQIVVAPMAPLQFELTVLLLDPDGLVVTGIDVMVVLREAEPSLTTKEASAASSYQSTNRRDATHAASFRQKPHDNRQLAHKNKRFHARNTVAALLKSSESAEPRRSKSKFAARN